MAYIGNQPKSATFAIDSFNGDGSTLNFTLRESPVSTSSILVFVGGVRQATDTYSLSGTTLVFSEAPPSGTNNIQVLFLGLGASPTVPSDGSVTAAKFADGAVSTAKIADGAVTAVKIAASTITGDKIAANTIPSADLTTTGVGAGTYGGSANIPVVTVDAQGRLTSAANVAFSATPAANSINETQIIPNIPLTLSNVFVTQTATFLGKVVEKVNIASQGIGTTTTIGTNDSGVVYFTGASSQNTTINFTGLGSISVGNVVSYMVIVTNNTANPKYISTIQIDGQNQGSSNTFWVGGAPTFGVANTEIYSFNIVKMSATPTYNVFAQVTNFRS